MIRRLRDIARRVATNPVLVCGRVRAPLLLLLVFGIGCQSAEHRELTSRLGDRKTLAYRSEANDHPFTKRWAVWTDLLVEHAPDKYASTRLRTLEEGEDSVDELVEQARRSYALRATGPDELELSEDGDATWIPIPVPVRHVGPTP